ncbi:hypothetical protein [Hansschlegelia sp. KR7-227]|uniref:hypothetical protein n=1 Tax=Hansschlegelia sp. KR7-227 TaxID=3400914 RepID=UPI003BFB5BB9
MTALPAPLIIGLVSSWSQRILIGDLVAGAKLSVFARDAAGAVVEIASGLTAGAGEQLVAITPPPAGTTLWAIQSLDGAESAGDPATGPVVTKYPGGSTGLPQLVSRLYIGSRALWIEGVFPGATVRVEQNGAVLGQGHAAALAGILNRPIGVRVVLGDHVAGGADVAIVATDPDGVEIARLTARPREPRDDYPSLGEHRLPPPVEIAGLAACASGAPLSNVIDGAEVTLIVNGAERARAFFDRPGLTFLLGPEAALKEGDVVQATQMLWSTGSSEPLRSVTVGPAPTPGAPGHGLICAGARMIVVANLDPDAALHVGMPLGSGEIAEIAYPPAGAFEGNGVRRITLPTPAVVGALKLWQSRCDKVGPTTEVAVDERRGDVPPATLLPPLRGCDEYVYRAPEGGFAVRLYSALAAEASGAGWPGGAISDWTIGTTVRVAAPLTAGDKIRAVVLACDNAQVWTPEDETWPVEPGAGPEETQQIAMGLLFSLTAGPIFSPLLQYAQGPVYIQKGPRAHLLTLTGGAAPLLLGTAIPEADGSATIALSRRLQPDETLLLEWWQCGQPIITKGNPTATVLRVEPPFAPIIEAPADGQTGLKLGEHPVRAVDAGVNTNRRAEWVSVRVAPYGGANLFQKTENGSRVEGAFRIDAYATTYVVSAFAGNSAGNSPVATANVASEAAPPPPPPAPKIVATTSETVDGDYGIITITVTGTGFSGQAAGKLSAKYRTAYFAGANVAYEDTTTPLKDFTIAADGSFTASGQATVQYWFRIADGSALVVNQGVMASVQIGSGIWEMNLLPTDQQTLPRVV